MKKLLIFLLIILQLLVSCNSDEPINTNESISTVNYLKEGFWCYSDTVFNKSGYLEKISSGYKFTFVKNILVLDINLDGNLSCSLSSGERFILGRDVNINGWSDAFILPGNQHNNSAFMSIKDSSEYFKI